MLTVSPPLVAFSSVQVTGSHVSSASVCTALKLLRCSCSEHCLLFIKNILILNMSNVQLTTNVTLHPLGSPTTHQPSVKCLNLILLEIFDQHSGRLFLLYSSIQCPQRSCILYEQGLLHIQHVSAET